ncbi:META domain-containing protein [Desulfovibrio sp. OttesenSCG-928-C06]|nr:META domain-containing protein [Desulfovibrio sp. OttesenSCG-928-C06]
MKNKLLLCALLVFAALAALNGCAGGKVENALMQKDLLHHNYVLETVDGEPFTSSFKTPNLSFNEGFRVGGAVCNNFFGQAELKDGVLKVEHMASTLMMCPDQQLNSLEATFGEMLRNGAQIRLEGDRLFLNQGGHELGYILKDYVN